MNPFISEIILSLPSATFILELLALIIASYFKKYNISLVCVLLLISKLIYLFNTHYQAHIYVSLMLPFLFALIISLKKDYDGFKCLLPVGALFLIYLALGVYLGANTTFIMNITREFLFKNSAISDISLVLFGVFFIYLLVLWLFIKYEKSLLLAYFLAFFEFLVFRYVEKIDVGFFEFASLLFLISIGIEGYKLAFIDALTKVYNRRAYERARVKNFDILAVCDIDFFKKVNDTYGHDAGDYILQSVAQVLSKNFNKVYRFGGEEFVILIKNEDFINCVTKLDKIRAELENTDFNFRNQLIKITISIGVELVACKKAQAFKNADAKLYKAKNSGRNRVIHE